jgi:D-alanyl-lipoteichoic acid acyltransferase DltB (MBOAT superfamily)
MAWTGAIAYTIQIFFDFSGYTDIVIGIGYLFGFKLPENFKYPYMASSISDFWKRWHISLTKWLTRYVYIPLGGSRVSRSRHIFNLFAVWLVTGMWHGSSATFIVWAMVYFLLQLAEKYTRWPDILKRLHIAHIYTLLIVMFEWVIFKSATLSSAVGYIRSMFTLNGNAALNPSDMITITRYAIPFVLGVIFSTDLGVRIKNTASNNRYKNAVYNFGLAAVFVICILIVISQGYTAPLYAGF